MISSVRGLVTAVGPDAVVVEVGGVGLLVGCTPPTLARLRVGEQASLATSLVVREDSLTLYGFADDDERATFELLQTATGVGPRLAQAVLSTLRPDQVRQALATEDLVALTRVPGVGHKGAQRLVLELKDKVAMPARLSTIPAGVLPPESPTGPPWRRQLLAALTGLGWTGREAEESVVLVTADLPPDADPDLALLLRHALRELGPRR